MNVASHSVFGLLVYATKCQFATNLLMVKNPENDAGSMKKSGSLPETNRFVPSTKAFFLQNITLTDIHRGL